MTYEEYLLVHLMEEASEVVKACSKALRFGLDHYNEKEGMTNRLHIATELMNVRVHANACVEYGMFPFPVDSLDSVAAENARDKGQRMLHLSIKLGTVKYETVPVRLRPR